MKYHIAQVIGLNTDQEAAQAISAFREGNNIFFGVLQIICDDAFTKGRQVLNEVMDDFFDPAVNTESLVAKRLIEAFVLAKDKLAEVQVTNLLLGAVSGKALYLVYQGTSAGYLKRGGKLSSLLSIGQPGQLISGFLQEDDRIFFGTANLAKLLGDELIKSIESPVNEWEEEVTIRISTGSLNNQGLAGLLIEVAAEREPEVKKPNPNEYQRTTSPLSVSSHLSGSEHKTSLFSKVNIFKSISAKFFTRKSRYSAESENYQPPVIKRNSFIRRIFPKSGRSKLILGLLLILIIFAGVAYKYIKNKGQEQQQQIDQLLQEARSDLSSAQNLSTLNPQEAKSKLDAAKTTVQKALAIKVDNQATLDLKKQIDQSGDQILQQFSSGNFSVYLDLSLIKPGFNPQRMSLSGTNLLLLDSTDDTLATIDISQKSQKILAGSDQMGAAKYISIEDSFGYIYSTDKGSLKVDITNQKVTSIAKLDKDLGGVADIVGFGGNVYLLDKTNNQIWKYLATTDGYSDKRAYLASGVKADFSGALRMQIDSSIYVLKDTGEILKYLRGNTDTFSYSGLDKPVSNPKSFFVSADTDNLYLLDSGNARLLVLDKTGVYKSQYQGNEFAKASDLVVDEKGKKVYLLDSGKIYTSDLK